MRGSGLSIDLNPSPGSHRRCFASSVRSDLSHKGRGEGLPALTPIQFQRAGIDRVIRPSLRAKRSNPYRGKKERVDCSVASLLAIAMTANSDAASRSRGAVRPGFALFFRPLPSEGAGNAGRPMRPIAARANVVVESTRVSQVTPESPGIPRAMVLRFPSRSPR